MRSLRAAALAVLALFAGCATPPPPKPTRTPEEVRAQLVSLIPATIKDRADWAVDIQRAFVFLDLPPSTENLCAVLGVIEQESTYVADPTVPGLARIAREEIDRRAARFHVPRLALTVALKLRSPNGKSYEERLAAVRTEQELSALFVDLIGQVPLGQRLFGGANPVRTGGPMQVGIAFAQQHARAHGYPYDGIEPTPAAIRREVFTRRGGLYFGIAHLLKYPNRYHRHLYRFADFNAGWYASRNAAFQRAVQLASGKPLVFDGDLLAPGAPMDKPGATEAALRGMWGVLQIDDAAIRDALRKGRSRGFEDTALYREVYAIAERKAGGPLARARVPQIELRSPKITRKLTTAWFAGRVDARWKACMAR